MKNGARREVEDLLIALVSTVVIAATWLVAFGWRVDLLNSRYDNIQQLLPVLKNLFAQNGDWRATLFRAEWLGGSELVAIEGAAPIYQLAARLGFSTLTAVNFAGFLVQFLCAFFGTRLALDVSALAFGETERRPSIAWLAGAALLLAFVPMLGWRFAFGDAQGLFGVFVFPAFLCAYTSCLRGRLSLVSVLVVLTAFTNALPSASQQHIFNGAVFGLPILVGMALLAPKRALRALGLPVLLFLASLLFIAPIYYEMVSYALSSDFARSTATPPLTYTSIVTRLFDWLASLPWFPGVIDSGRPTNLHHETNYPLGPLLILPFMLIGTKKLRPLLIGIAVSAVLALALASDIRPLSSLLLALLPPLKMFRVPVRAIRPAYLMLPILCLVAIEGRLRAQKAGKSLRPAPWGALALWPLFHFLPSLGRELLTEAGALAFALWPSRKRFHRLVSADGVTLALGVMSAVAFGARLFPFSDSDELLAFPAEQRQRLLSLEPRLASPLTRAIFRTKLATYDINTSFAFGVASLEGYWHPPRRFGELFLALKNRDYDPTYLTFSLSSPGELALSQLYNACCSVTLDNGALKSTPLAATGAGEAWFSTASRALASTPELAATLVALGPRVAATVHRELWLIENDPATNEERRQQAVPQACRDAKVVAVRAETGSQLFRVAVDLPLLPAGHSCPLTLAMNYAENLEATAFAADGSTSTLKTFPAYGSLLATEVPAATREVAIEAIPREPLLARLAPLAGLVCVAASLFSLLDGRKKRR